MTLSRLALVSAITLIWASLATAADLEKIERKILKEPSYKSRSPRYCLLVFGPEAKTRVWLVLDVEGNALYVDKNGNGDLTEETERVPGPGAADQGNGTRIPVYRVDEITEPDTSIRHTNLKVSVYSYSPDGRHPVVPACEISVRIRDKYTQTAGAGGQLVFARRPQDAPIVHFNGPLTPQLSGKAMLARGQENELYVEVGTSGLGAHSYAWIAYQRIPAKFHPIAEIEYPNKNPEGPPVKSPTALDRRC